MKHVRSGAAMKTADQRLEISSGRMAIEPIDVGRLSFLERRVS